MCDTDLQTNQSRCAMDFVSIWKAVSIVVTGFFGGLALLIDFKDKTSNRITTWGYVSLLGIVCSTAFGVAAQLKETNDKAREHQTTLEQTLTLAKNTRDSIVNIKRVLSAIDEPVVEIRYVSPCPTKNKKLSALCVILRCQCRSLERTFLQIPDHIRRQRMRSSRSVS